MKLRELTSVNTQVRRLGYFPKIIQFVEPRSLGAEILFARLVSWGKENQRYLQDYQDATGDVVPRTIEGQYVIHHNSTLHAAKRYTNVAHEAGWITQVSGAYAVTRVGRVLLTLQDVTKSQATNPFLLSLEQRLYFIHELWRKDGDILFTVLHQLVTPLPLSDIQELFQRAYLNHLNERMEQTQSEHENRKFFERQKNIKDWRSPVRYAEHIVPPRLHWLMDLGFVDIDKSPQRVCSLTDTGHMFRQEFATLETLLDTWLDCKFYKTLARCIDKNGSTIKMWQCSSDDGGLLQRWLLRALIIFRRGTVPKYSVSQVVLFLCIIMLAQEEIAVDQQDILAFLAKPLQFDADHVIETRLSARENESYLILNPV